MSGISHAAAYYYYDNKNRHDELFLHKQHNLCYVNSDLIIFPVRKLTLGLNALECDRSI